MTPSNVGSEASSRTGEGLDASRYIITPVDISSVESEDVVPLLTRDLEALNALFAKTRNRADVVAALEQVNLAGINYRTLALRLDQGLEQGDDTTRRAWERGKAALRREHRDFMATGRELAAQYPDIRRDIDERFDKFDFGLPARRAD